MIAALFQLAPMFLTALDKESVLTMTYVNVRRSGLVRTAPSSRAALSTTVLVGVPSITFETKWNMSKASRKIH